jgi:hypothetical protein
LLLIAGDVHPQPGPSAAEKTKVKQTTVKCPQCEKTVKRNHKRVECDKCFDLFHIRCVYSNSWFIKNTGAHDPRSWTCPECTLSELPFLNVNDYEILERKGNEQINSTLGSELKNVRFYC